MATTFPIKCGFCEHDVGAEVVTGDFKPNQVAWLRCPLCREGSVRSKHGLVFPVAPVGRAVANLPDDVRVAWQEARTAHAVAAYTASEMMCRKILMHLAVDVAGADEKKTFVQYVDALDQAGYIITGLKGVVDLVRSRGNIANHELPASTETDSLRTIAITEHLLHSIYELPGLAPPSSESSSS